MRARSVTVNRDEIGSALFASPFFARPRFFLLSACSFSATSIECSGDMPSARAICPDRAARAASGIWTRPDRRRPPLQHKHMHLIRHEHICEHLCAKPLAVNTDDTIVELDLWMPIGRPARLEGEDLIVRIQLHAEPLAATATRTSSSVQLYSDAARGSQGPNGAV